MTPYRISYSCRCAGTSLIVSRSGYEGATDIWQYLKTALMVQTCDVTVPKLLGSLSLGNALPTTDVLMACVPPVSFRYHPPGGDKRFESECHKVGISWYRASARLTETFDCLGVVSKGNIPNKFV